GDNGRIRFDERSFEHISEQGQTVDSSGGGRRRSAAPDDGIDDPAIEAVADGIKRMLDPHAPKSPPVDLGAVLAICEAAILSARTGQPESPATILRMARAT